VIKNIESIFFLDLFLINLVRTNFLEGG
jgi:hypothetical protein